MIFISILILIVAIALPSFNKHLSPILFTRISSIIFIYAGALSFNALYIQSIGSGIGIYSGLFHVTVVSQFIEVFIFFIGSLILVSWPNINNISNKFNNKNAELIKTSSVGTEYSLLVLFTTLGASLLISSNDLISMYLSIELQSFGVYILATLYRDSESATKAGLKYFLLGGLSSCIILLGAGLIYTYTGLTNFESIFTLISALELNNILQGFSLGLILIVVGFLFKIAAAPLHNWAPDVYDDSPTIVTIWLTIMPKISILILLLILQVEIGLIGQINSISHNTIEIMPNMITNIKTFIIGENISYVLKNLLLLSSLLSLIIGTVLGLAQNRIKRLLAYSTISHIGFILLAIAINTEQSIDSLIFYIIQYSLTNLNTFLIIIALGYTLQSQANKLINFNINNKDINYVDIRYINSLKGIFSNNPILSLSLSICLFSMAGMPPLIGFFSKQFVLSSAIQSGYYFMAIIAIIVSVISASYYLKVIKVLHNNEESLDNELLDNKNITSNIKEDSWKEVDNNLSTTYSTNEKNNSISITNYHSFLISSLTLSILLFVLKPSIILNSTQLLSLSIFNN